MTIYKKISDTEIKEIISEEKETVYSVEDLYLQKEHISNQIVRQKDEFAKTIIETEKALNKIENLIIEAKKLKIKKVEVEEVI